MMHYSWRNNPLLVLHGGGTSSNPSEKDFTSTSLKIQNIYVPDKFICSTRPVAKWHDSHLHPVTMGHSLNLQDRHYSRCRLCLCPYLAELWWVSHFHWTLKKHPFAKRKRKCSVFFSSAKIRSDKFLHLKVRSGSVGLNHFCETAQTKLAVLIDSY